ncbi:MULTISPECIES: HEAT repeat domain-containing protein [unclassified Myxococcus]|uniref:HEAT repeat domain-containing protein n=1 Tax=unclassified Myxococcus TaxID=2648731 RepID=UPI00157B365C|nr:MULTISPECIES: HEAT repeat domain-containing protein [unclassified Myxococcus]NTX41563.1 HEAT repeat domain-containing protein [Myxococcus sp. CA033]NTX52028.1 HEAT repeat domain-containing protein [Myxococcus sp. CA039A]
MTRTFLLARALCLLTSLSLLAPSPSLAQATGTPLPPPALQPETCSVEGLMDSIRRGLQSKSPAYRRYLRELLKESAVTLPEEQLRAAFERETEPLMVEHLAAALAAKTDRGESVATLQLVGKRASQDADPAVRAAATRALRRTSAEEHTGDLYSRLVRDASPEVRMEAATNLIEDNQFVYAGFHGPASDTAVAAAAASSDAKVTARILGNISTAAISKESAEQLHTLLRGDDAEVRAAAAKALGGVPAPEMSRARQTLVALYRDESDVGVRTSILQSLARLGFASAVPELRGLRNVDPRLVPEVDAWIRALSTGLQEWSLILREKQRLQQAR